MRGAILWILWNLFLAFIPVVLGQGAAYFGRLALDRRDRRLWLAVVPLLLVWLIFLPNTCYLFTEPRHFMQVVDERNLWFRAAEERAALIQLLLRGAVGVMYVMAGALSFALAIRPVHRLAPRIGLAAWMGGLPFFVLMSLGVYLGLILRYNSWELLTQPGLIFTSAWAAVQRPRLLLVILAFGGFLWAAYGMMDIWIDGFLARWMRFMQGESRTEAGDAPNRSEGQP
jgi:uncharacterized membrane protein